MAQLLFCLEPIVPIAAMFAPALLIQLVRAFGDLVSVGRFTRPIVRFAAHRLRSARAYRSKLVPSASLRHGSSLLARGLSYDLASLTVFRVVGRQIGRFQQTYDVWLTPTLAEPPVPLGTMSRRSATRVASRRCRSRFSGTRQAFQSAPTADDDQASSSEARDELRVERCHEILQEARSPREAYPRVAGEEILEQERNAAERAADRLRRGRSRLVVHRCHDRVERGIDPLDPRDGRLDKLERADRSRPDEIGQSGGIEAGELGQVRPRSFRSRPGMDVWLAAVPIEVIADFAAARDQDLHARTDE